MGILFPEELSGVAIADESSGLSIAWVSDDPPLERRSQFVLCVGQQEVTFWASYKQSTGIIMSEFQGISVLEALQKAKGDMRILFHASDIPLDFDKNIFVRLWHKVIKSADSNSIVKVVYSEGSGLIGEELKEWSFGYE